MPIEKWWSLLDAPTQDWLIANNGDALSADIIATLEAASGEVGPNASWSGRKDSDGTHLTDEEVDWIEEVANGER
ncbi:MAG: hypothetical protein H7288_09045 [Kineosporiaceae bacterium]|nr:hypothetical protein [Aeromicrobium sp.]